MWLLRWVMHRPSGPLERLQRWCQYCGRVRFEQRLRDGIHSGEIVVAFRRWKRSQVVPGHRYRTGIDMVKVETLSLDVGYRLSPRGESYLNYQRTGEYRGG